MKKALGGFTAIILAGLLASAPLVAQTAGEEWEYQGNIDMMGMKMPVPVTRRCEEPQHDVTPPVQENCKVTETSTSGDTTSFSISCGPPEPMEGTGTMTQTGTLRESLFTLKSEQGEMSFAMTGKKLGSCNL
jgi:hypothetical protein